MQVHHAYSILRFAAFFSGRHCGKVNDMPTTQVVLLKEVGHNLRYCIAAFTIQLVRYVNSQKHTIICN